MPDPLPRSQSGALLDGLRFLGRRPGWTLGLVALGTLLGQLGPALELAAKTRNDPTMGQVLTTAALLPMGLYFIPRWIARLDADLLDAPMNASIQWPKPFDQRWLRAFGANMIVESVISLALAFMIIGGASLLGLLGLFLIIPGIVFLILTGFAPMRVLLRGDVLGEAFRWSVKSMARCWPRIVQAALAILLLAFAGSLAMALAQNAVFARFGDAGPDAWTRLKHPLAWASQILETLDLLWVSASFLSLFHRLERLATDQSR